MNRCSRLGTVCHREESEEKSIAGMDLTEIRECSLHIPSVCMQSMMSNPLGEIVRRRFN